ncbi:MAG: Ig-like domain-containing protein, partial [Myxococcales bacterium]|nr:Ig-like domain-containing protein [Myxococcales bacterium]
MGRRGQWGPIVALAMLGMAACDDGSSGDARGDGGAAAGQAASALEIAGGDGALSVGGTLDLTATATLADGSARDVTAEATWTSSNPDVLTVDGGQVVGVAVGQADVTCAFGGASQTRGVEVVAATPPTALRVEAPAAELKVGAETQLTVIGTRDDGGEVNLTAEATWETSDAAVATVAAGGVATLHRGGAVTLTAHVGELSATLDTVATCDYPRFSNAIRYGSVIPPLFWEGAYRPDGTTFDFRLADVYCNAEYADVSVVFFIVSAGWCAPCTLYQQRLLPEAAAIEAAGGLLVILEAETTDFGPASNVFAQNHVEHIVGDSYAIRVGDHDAQPRPDWLHMQPIVTAFPTVIAVRTRDMQVVTDSNHSDYYLPLLQIAQDPEADWSDPGPPPFANHCAEGDEEDSEPNDTPAQAAPLAPGEVSGGICAEEPDYYAIDVEGEWRVSLDFDGDVGDLDVFVWDEALDQPLQDGADVVGSNGTTSHETFVWHGPATLVVF